MVPGRPTVSGIGGAVSPDSNFKPGNGVARDFFDAASGSRCEYLTLVLDSEWADTSHMVKAEALVQQSVFVMRDACGKSGEERAPARLFLLEWDLGWFRVARTAISGSEVLVRYPRWGWFRN